MRVVIQRVKSSSVEINQKIKSKIEKGLLVLVGISTLELLTLCITTLI